MYFKLLYNIHVYLFDGIALLFSVLVSNGWTDNIILLSLYSGSNPRTSFDCQDSLKFLLGSLEFIFSSSRRTIFFIFIDDLVGIYLYFIFLLLNILFKLQRIQKFIGFYGEIVDCFIFIQRYIFIYLVNTPSKIESLRSQHNSRQLHLTEQYFSKFYTMSKIYTSIY